MATLTVGYTYYGYTYYGYTYCGYTYYGYTYHGLSRYDRLLYDELPRQGHTLLYTGMLRSAGAEAWVKALSCAADRSSGAVLVHCAKGKDRTRP